MSRTSWQRKSTIGVAYLLRAFLIIPGEISTPTICKGGIGQEITFQYACPASYVQYAESFPQAGPLQDVVQLFRIMVAKLIPPVGKGVEEVRHLVHGNCPSQTKQSANKPLRSVASLNRPTRKSRNRTWMHRRLPFHTAFL